MASTASANAASTEVQVETQETQLLLKNVKKPVEKHRKDYKVPDFVIDHVDLEFDIEDAATTVEATLTMHRREGVPPCMLKLDGEELKLHKVEMDGKAIDRACQGNSCDLSSTYSIDEDSKLVIPSQLLPPESGKTFTLKTTVTISPINNFALSGLYKSSGLFCTQCEAEGFRRITYFLDRPDIMTSFKVKIKANKASCPVLLSNGNLIDSGNVDGSDDKHFAVFEDPHKKPSYLFALVAGNIDKISREFTTMSGKKVMVEVYSVPQEKEKLHWALESTIRAMKWDEEWYGREYDLDTFRIVCCHDFNMGAMENKGLNIFNSALLLAHPKTTTDSEFQRILNVVGHEYFHNWTGNRVTCRDWFQLTLKEGLTVFRDQQFTSTEYPASVKRIEDVTLMRSRQFAEDNGPMAHPIRPEKYIAMDNFYTVTVYDKGAEVIRMYHTLLGSNGFRKGMDLYFERHDGQAVTCDDFRAAMSDANGRDLSQFERWYLQAGTPTVEVVSASYDSTSKSYTLALKQSTPPTPGQPEKLPFHIPVVIGLIGKESKKDLLSPKNMILELTEAEQTFVIPDVSEDCVPSILRDFSAPVKLLYPAQTDEDIAFLMAYDSDDFSRWQAGYSLAAKTILDRTRKIQAGKVGEIGSIPSIYANAFKTTLNAKDVCQSMQANTLKFPDRESLSHELEVVDPEALHQALASVRKDLRSLFLDDLEKKYQELTVTGEETQEGKDMSRRALRNVILSFVTAELDEKAAKIAYDHYKNAKTMTDKYAALSVLVECDSPLKKDALDDFFKFADGDALTIDKWFSVQAKSNRSDCPEKISELQKHPEFNMKNPNRLRSLVSVFSRTSIQFHRKDGKGYKILSSIIQEVDRFNNQQAAGLATNFLQWKRYDGERQKLMLAELRNILATPGLSQDTVEICEKALAEAPPA